MDQFHFLQSPVAAAREWWYSNVVKENPSDDDDDGMEDQLKDFTDDSSSQSSENVVSLKVGIHCEECKRIVADALWCMHGVDRVDVDKIKQKVTVTGRVTSKRVLRAVKRTGKCVELWKSSSDSKKDLSYEGRGSSNDSRSNNNNNSEGVVAEEDEEDALCAIM